MEEKREEAEAAEYAAHPERFWVLSLKEGNMEDKEKMFYAVDEVLELFNLTLSALSRKLVLYNIEVRQLPGSNKEYIATSDVMLLEQAIKDPGSVA